MQIEIHEHALDHGFTVGQILNALRDPQKRKLPSAKENKRGVKYKDDGRVRYLAQDKPTGPLLHIVVIPSPGKLLVFHCREMTPSEKRAYR